jgi:membrane associated rhomboid family serine protease
MLFLVAFGPRIEALFGHLRFLGFYLACGVLGGIAQVSAMPGSHVPSIGASGAIAGVLGAFIVRYPTERILRLPAVLVIGVWAVVQFVHGFAPVTSEALSERGGSIAYFAHIGGFLAGIFAASLFSKSRGSRQGPRVRSRHY